MRCSHCQAVVSERVRFCTKCGEPIPLAAPAITPLHTAPEEKEASSKPGKPKRMLAMTLLVLVALIAAVWIGRTFMSKRQVALLQPSGPILRVPPAIAFRGGTGGSEVGSSRLGKASPDDIAAAKRDVQAHPNDPRVLNDAGCILQTSDEKQVGFDLLAKAHQLAPEDPIITYNYARGLYSQGKVNEATQQAQAALQRKPDLDEAHILLADIATQKKDYDAADQQLKNLANVMKEIKVAALTIQAAILMGKGKLQEAYQMFQQALTLDQQDPTSLYNAGLGSQMLGKLPQAQNYYQQALQLNPNLAEAHNNLGTVLMALQQFAAALDQLRAASADDPSNATFASNLNALQQPGSSTASVPPPNSGLPSATPAISRSAQPSSDSSSATPSAPPPSAGTPYSSTVPPSQTQPSTGSSISGSSNPLYSKVVGTWKGSWCGLEIGTLQISEAGGGLTGTMVMRELTMNQDASTCAALDPHFSGPPQQIRLNGIGFDGRTLWFSAAVGGQTAAIRLQYSGGELVMPSFTPGADPQIYRKVQ